ncbi:MAG: DMT family transporter [Marinosulfonomonas sp.]
MKTHPNPRLAIMLISAATAFIAASTFFAKTLSTDMFGPAMHPLQITQGRFIFALAFFGIGAAWMRPQIAKPNLKRHLTRTFFGWAGVTLMFAAVGYIPLGDATAISFLNPVFAMILAIPLLGERVGPVRWSAAFIAFIGALILLRPGMDSFQPAALLALGAALMLGVEVIFIKRLSATEPPFQILLINNGIGLVIASVAAVFVWQQPTAMQWLALVGVGVSMASAQALFVNAMARADASLLAPFTYATLIFATLYDFIFFSVVPEWASVLGAIVIISGAALLAWREARIRAL